MLTVIRLGLPDQLRRSLGCTNAIESLMAVLRQVCRNAAPSANAARRPAHCTEKSRRVGFNQLAPAAPISTGTRTIRSRQ
jgi:hypothetical protein